MKLVICIKFGLIFMLTECVAVKIVPHKPFNTSIEMENVFFENLNNIPDWNKDDEIVRICELAYCVSHHMVIKRYDFMIRDKNECKATPIGKKPIVDNREPNPRTRFDTNVNLLRCVCYGKHHSRSRTFCVAKGVKANSYFLLDEKSTHFDNRSHDYHNIYDYVEFEESKINWFSNMLNFSKS